MTHVERHPSGKQTSNCSLRSVSSVSRVTRPGLTWCGEPRTTYFLLIVAMIYILVLGKVRNLLLLFSFAVLLQSGKGYHFNAANCKDAAQYMAKYEHDQTCVVTSDRPLRIAVAGAGVGGVLIGYALEKKGFDVTVFEKTAKFSRFGGPIQLASNALSCINSISPELFDQVMARFTFTGTRKCGIKDGIRNEWYSVFDAIKDLATSRSLPYTGVIDRPDLQEILLQGMKPGTIRNSMEVKRYDQHPNGTVDVYTVDGSVTRGFDVLVGADGIWSAVRQQMWGEGPKPGSCMYSGYTLFAAETVMPPDSPFYKSEGYFDVGYKVYIGPGKYFVTSDVGSGRIQWYAFLALPPGTRARRESDGSISADCSGQSCVPTTDAAGNAVSCNGDFLRAQFAGWTEEIHACLGNTPESLIEQRDLYDRPPSMSTSWSEGHVTMLGDAVHPMMPNLGQGGGQAMEDVFVLTDLLSEVRDRRDIPAALQEYYKRRILRSAAVQGMSRLSSDVIISKFSTPFSPREFLQQGFGYKYLTWPSLMTWNMRPMLPMLFRAQFSYLYSYAPSSFTAERIRELVLRSLTRNEAEVRQVYQQLSNSTVTFFSAKSMSFMAYDRRTRSVRKVAEASELRKKAAALL